MPRIAALLLPLTVAIGCTTPPASAAAPAPAAPTAPTINSPSTVTDYRRVEREVLADLNAARTNPAQYADELASLLPMYTGLLVRRPGWRYAAQTEEGAAAVREAIAALRAQHALPPLLYDSVLSRSALDHARDQGRTGAIGHTGADGSTPSSRMNRYGAWTGSAGENIDYGAVVAGRDVVEDLIIDDGVPGRGHRHNIFDMSSHVVGVGCGPHPTFGVVCVIDQAAGFIPRAVRRQY